MCLCATQTDNAVHQSSVPDAAARAPGDALLPANADLHDIQRMALHDGGAGRRHWILSLLLEEIGNCRCHRALSLADAHLSNQEGDPLQPAVSHPRRNVAMMSRRPPDRSTSHNSCCKLNVPFSRNAQPPTPPTHTHTPRHF